MKSSLVALAALACAATASAQSSVTIYGRLDVGVTRQNDGTTSLNGSNGQTGAAGERWDVRQGSGNRLGFRGTEDLGGGLSAGFHFEHRFTADNGAADATFWAARSYLQLQSKTLGRVYLGREYIPAFFPALRLDPWGFDTVGTPGPKHQLANYTIDGGIRSNNTVGYQTPSFAGLTVQAAIAAGEGTRPRGTGVNVEYLRGGLYLAAAMDRQSDAQKVALVGGSYDFGFVKPMLTYQRSKVAGVDHRNLSAALTAPIGAGVLKAGWFRLDPTGADNNTTKVGLGYEYFLSKRTSIYADVGSADQEGRTGLIERTRTTAVDLGLKHNF